MVRTDALTPYNNVEICFIMKIYRAIITSNYDYSQ